MCDHLWFCFFFNIHASIYALEGHTGNASPWLPLARRCECQRGFAFPCLLRYLSEVIDISPGNLDSSLCFFQPSISHNGTFIQIDYILGHKINLNKFKCIQVIRSVFAEELNQKSITERSLETNKLLQNPQVKEEFKSQIQMYFKLNVKKKVQHTLSKESYNCHCIHEILVTILKLKAEEIHRKKNYL